MEKKKLIKKDYYEMIMKETNNPEIIAFCKHEIELLEKKSSKSSQTKTQIENEKIKVTILESLTRIAKPVTITELQELDTEMAQYSNQKLSALLKALTKEGLAVRTENKKKAYFSVNDKK